LNKTDFGARSYVLGAFTNEGALANPPSLFGTVLTYTGSGQPNCDATQIIHIVTDNYEVITATLTFAATGGASGGVAVSCMIRSYNPKNDITAELINKNHQYKVVKPGWADAGQADAELVFTGVEPGTYTLIITKPGHLKLTVHNIIVNDTDLDLRDDGREGVGILNLICGNVNTDSQINSADLLLLLNNYLKSGDSIKEPAADINGDNQVNSSDLLLLLINYLKSDQVIN